MDAQFNSRNVIRIANRSAYDVLVVATSNKDWAAADIGFAFLSAAVVSAVMPAKGATSGAATAAQASKLSRTINSARALYGAFGKARKIYSAVDALTRKQMEKQQDYAADLFRRIAIPIPRGDDRVVNEKSLNPFYDLRPAVPANFKDAMIAAAGQRTGSDIVRAAEYADLAKGFITNLTNLADPSNFMSVIGDVADMTLFIATADFSRMTCFNSNSGHSWIVHDQEIVRADPQAPGQANRSLGWQIFSNNVGSVLGAGESLNPGDSLDIQTVNYSDADGGGTDSNRPPARTDNPDLPTDLTARTEPPAGPVGPSRLDEPVARPQPRLQGGDEAPQQGGWSTAAHAALRAGGKFVEQNVTDPAIRIGQGIAGAAKTIGSSPYKLYYHPDGNLVLYKIAGDMPQEKWSTGTSGQGAWRVVMETDGNLVVYSAQGKVAWSLWQKVPSHIRAGSYIALNRVTGDLEFYNGRMDTPDFAINSRPDAI